MGKTNQAERTKGNAKASSSARAAELLTASGAPVYAFGFAGNVSSEGAGSGTDAVSTILPTASSATFSAVGTPLSQPSDADASTAFLASHLCADLQLLLKKLEKKDKITKRKALTELVAMLEDDDDEAKQWLKKMDGKKSASKRGNSHCTDINQGGDDDTRKRLSPEDVKAFIPFWARIFNALTIDSDMKIRELTQQAMLQLVKPERKKLLGPHVKNIIGAWMLALADSYAPAASAALQAFDAALSKERQFGVVRKCRKEIFVYLQDILLHHSPTTLSDPKSTIKDEMESKYERVVAAALVALKTLTEMTVDEIEASADAETLPELKKSLVDFDSELEILLSNKKMVNLSVHSNPMIRAAWFDLLASVCTKRPRLLKKRDDSEKAPSNDGKLTSLLASSVLNRFEETDPTVVGALWNAVMAVLKVIPDPWSYVSLRKNVLPKLFLLLRTGCGGNVVGGGNAVIIGPHIVVLVSKLPIEIVGLATENDDETSPALSFYQQLSGATMDWLDKGVGDKIYQSPSEIAALLLCLAECLQFLLSNHTGAGNDERLKKKKTPLIRELVALLRVALGHKYSKQILSSHFFHVFGNVLAKIEEADGKADVECAPEKSDVTSKDATEATVISGDGTAIETSNVSLCALFWDGFQGLIESRIDSEDLGSVEKLIGVLKEISKTTGNDKTIRRVSFASETQTTQVLRQSSTDAIPTRSPFKTRMLCELKSVLHGSLQRRPTIPSLTVFCQLCDGESNETFVRRLLRDVGATNKPSVDLRINTERYFNLVFRNVWLPLKSKFDARSALDVSLNLARLLRNLALNLSGAEIPIDVIEGAVFGRNLGHPLFYRAIKEALSSRVARGADDSRIRIWLTSVKILDFEVETIRSAIFQDPKSDDDRTEANQCLAWFLVAQPDCDPTVIRRVALLLIDALQTHMKMDGTVDTSLSRYLALSSNLLDRLAEMGDSDDNSVLSARLRVLIWTMHLRCILRRVKSTVHGDALKVAHDAVLRALQSGIPKSHAMELGSVTREILFGKDRSTSLRDLENIVSFFVDVFKYLKRDHFCLFLEHAFSTVEEEEGMTIVAREMWLKREIIHNRVFIDLPLSAHFVENDDESNRVFIEYVTKLALLSKVLLRLDAPILDFALDCFKNADSYGIASLISDIAFLKEFLAYSPTSKEHRLRVGSEENNNEECLVATVKRDFSKILLDFLPDTRDEMTEERVREFLSEFTGIMDSEFNDSSIERRYGNMQRVNFVSLLKGRSRSESDYSRTLFDILKTSPSFHTSTTTKNVVDLALEDDLTVNSNLLGTFYRCWYETDDESLEFLSSRLYALKHVSSKVVATDQGAFRLAQFFNDLLRAKSNLISEHLLGCSDLAETSWSILQFNVCLMDLVGSLVKWRPFFTTVESSTSDFVLCSVLGWTQTLGESIGHLDPATDPASSEELRLKVLTFARSCCELVAAVSRAFCVKCDPVEINVENEDNWFTPSTLGVEVSRDTTTESSLAKEWNRNFEEPVLSVMLATFIRFAGYSKEVHNSKSSGAPGFSASTLWSSVALASVAAAFRSALECCVSDKVLLSEDVEIEAKLIADDLDTWKSGTPHLQSVFNRITSFFIHPLVDVQLLSFHLLRRLMPTVVQLAGVDYAKEAAKREKEAECVEEEDVPKSSFEGWRPPSALVELFESAQSAFEFLVQGMDVGETLRFDAECDDDNGTRSYVISYILAWNGLRQLLGCASPELRVQYAISIREGISKILHHLLFLLPDCLLPDSRSPGVDASIIGDVSRLPLGAILDVARGEDVSVVVGSQDPNLPPRINAASTDAAMADIGANFYLASKVSGRSTSKVDVIRNLNGLAGATFIGTFRDLPNSVRQWWTDADRKTTALVERVCSLYISPVLTARELNSVEEDQNKVGGSGLENITVKVSPQSREVVAIYVMDEITMELLIKVPTNFPLGRIAVDCARSVGEVKEQKRWMMQLATFLHHQSGSIVDGIAMWKKNIDKPFEGVDPCMVCFSVLHSRNCQLPKLTCKACKKKFHSVCLYKWFNTSNNSSCPLCRSLF